MSGPHPMKQIALIVIVVIVGALLRSIDSLAGVDLWRWSLGDVVAWASFTVAAVAAAVLATQLGDPAGRPVLGSFGVARLGWCVMAGAAFFFLSKAVQPVLVPAWRNEAETALAVLLVALAAYAVWIVYGQFEDIAAAVKRLQPAMSPAGTAGAAGRPGAAASTATPVSPTRPEGAAAAAFCDACGTALAPTSRFCPGCGKAR